MADAILAAYADIKTVKTRGVYQIVFEGPIEQMGEAFALFGAPQPAAEVWAGIARVDPNKAQVIEQRPLSMAQLAGILCNTGGFRRFVSDQIGGEDVDVERAANFVRLTCGVKSRSEIDGNAHARRQFAELRGAYDMWLKGYEVAA